MASVEDVILSELSGPLQDLWLGAHNRTCANVLTQHAATLLDFDAGRPIPGWDRLDDPVYRTAVVDGVADRDDRLVNALADGRKRVNEALVRNGKSEQSTGQLKQKFRTVLPQLLALPSTAAALAQNPFPALLRPIAHQVAAGVHQLRVSGSSEPDWRLTNRLLLSAYLLTCRLPSAALVRRELQDLHRSILGLRGSLVRIPELVSGRGILDPVPRLTMGGNPGRLQHAGLSALLQATQDEWQAVATGNGVVHRILGLCSPLTVPAPLRGVVTGSNLPRYRSLLFRQYEYTILGYMALASIEQLLRAWAEHDGVPHINGTEPISATVWIGKLKNCPATLRTRLTELYDSDGPNIRNRIMHGGLLEIESKRLELVLSVPNLAVPAAPLSLTGDPYLPENIARLCLECLQELDREVAAKAALSRSHLAWTSVIGMPAADIDLGLHVHCDFRDGSPLARAWMDQLNTYHRALVPSLKQCSSVGFHGWLQPYTLQNGLVQFLFSGLVFEALYRQTAALLGFEVLQKTPKGTDSYFQHRMLSTASGGLCDGPIQKELLEHLDTGERDLAWQVVMAAVQARNTLAHGAILDFDDSYHKGVGHLFIKSQQLLMSAGLFHMNREAAFFRYRRLHPTEDRRAVEDWLVTEPQVLAYVAQMGALP
jgi:hypothetical protein